MLRWTRSRLVVVDPPTPRMGVVSVYAFIACVVLAASLMVLRVGVVLTPDTPDGWGGGGDGGSGAAPAARKVAIVTGSNVGVG